MLTLINLTCDYKTNPIDIGMPQPCFGYYIRSDKNNVKQTCYQIQVSQYENFESMEWDSGEVFSQNSTHIVYQGNTLISCTKYLYRARIGVESGEKSAWSEAAYFETSILDNNLWLGDFISESESVKSNCENVIYLKKEFSAKWGIKKARLYATAKGLYSFDLNGTPVSEFLLTPGWTEYSKNLLFQVYDVTELVRIDKNKLRAHLGYGWYGRLGDWIGQNEFKDSPAALLAQLEIEYENGEKEVIKTDESWLYTESPVVRSSIYDGEEYDNSHATGYWRNATVTDKNKGLLTPHNGDYVKRQEKFKPVAKIITPNGDTVFDFGQNMSGFVRLTVEGKKGDRVVLRHCETLDKDGNFYTANLRGAKQQLIYTLNGDGVEVYEPQFTFYGFRYIAVDSFPTQPEVDNFTAVAIYSDMPQTGTFQCSNQLINQLVQNTKWGMKSNYVDIPTDCPQRDERLGWTGDAVAFSRAAPYFMQIPTFFRKWMLDMRLSQFECGGIPFTVPDMFNGVTKEGVLVEDNHSAAGWADAVVICPYVIYKYFGDKQILQDNFSAMERWISYVKSQATNGVLWENERHFGDWLALDSEPGSFKGATPNCFTATAFYANSVALMVKICKALEKDGSDYESLFEDIKRAFIKEYYDYEGNLLVQTQTAHVLALQFSLFPLEHLNKTANRLAEMIIQNGLHQTTGFLGTPFICSALATYGHLSLAFELLQQTSYPSWLYPITKGATTIWEHWDGLKPDGSMWSADMNSFNHYAYGAVCDFIFSTIGGLDSDEVLTGFQHSRIAPKPGRGINFANTSFKTLYGEIVIEWKHEKDCFTLYVSIPCNTTATVTLPNGYTQDIGSGQHKLHQILPQD